MGLGVYFFEMRKPRGGRGFILEAIQYNLKELPTVIFLIKE